MLMGYKELENDEVMKWVEDYRLAERLNNPIKMTSLTAKL